MEIGKLFESLWETLGQTLPSLVGALAILLIGWFVSLGIRAATRKSLKLLNLNQRLRSSTGSEMNLESGIASAVYYVVLLLVLIAFFNALELELVSGPLQALVNQVFEFLPRLVAGGVLLLVAWIIASIVRTIVTKVLSVTSLDEKLSSESGMRPMSNSLGNVFYWLVFLLFLPAILGALELTGLLDPVQAMVDKVLVLLPNLLAAGVVAFGGWWVAKIVRDLVSNLLSATGADRLGETTGLTGTMSLSRLVGFVVYILILVPALVAALDILNIQAISGPATQMLNAVMVAIPNIFAAAIILIVALLIGRLVSDILSKLLGGVGFDTVPEKLGLGQAFSEEMTASKLIGKVILFFIMLFASVEAANRLGFRQVSDMVSMFIQFGSQVLLGGVVIAVGFWLSNLVYTGLSRAASSSVANITRFTILGFVLAVGLRAMGFADDIVNLAFGLTLGAIAVAVALSFGLGGREAAGKQMEYWLSQLRGDRKK